VRLLLDTCTFLWWAREPARLSTTAQQHIRHPSNEVMFSAASAWEIAVKWNIGRLDFATNPQGLLQRILAEFDLTVLPVSLTHALASGRLARHHDNPFDRLLIAQAEVEGLTIVTPDPAFIPYGVPLLW
jgi:PIN domain nuclease of toxin-antitoxin system